ncbi:MAG: hypothetical protein NDI94_04725 [Candidatus Woesearchaeota archaeon]|nr:hypothetical protein [Candidatus Woesearchaeota archaeon]
MTIWTPKHPSGIRTQWAPPASDATWTESNLLVYNTQIKQVRLIHVENVYRYMYHWLVEEMWRSEAGDNWFEDFYGEFRDQHAHKEIRWWWRVKRSPGGIAGDHPFFMQKWYIDVLTVNMKRVEMMYKGKKIKPYVGEFLMWFNAVLELDVNNWFGKGTTFKIGEFLEDFFLRMIYKDRVREQEVELRRESERFIEDLKFYIGLNRASELRKPIEDSKQWF